MALSAANVTDERLIIAISAVIFQSRSRSLASNLFPLCCSKPLGARLSPPLSAESPKGHGRRVLRLAFETNVPVWIRVKRFGDLTDSNPYRPDSRLGRVFGPSFAAWSSGHGQRSYPKIV